MVWSCRLALGMWLGDVANAIANACATALSIRPFKVKTAVGRCHRGNATNSAFGTSAPARTAAPSQS